MTKTMLKSAIVAVAMVMMAGCASQGMQAKIDQAMRKAEAAQAAANQAQQTATQALQVANEALECCQANSQRIERMFEVSQRK